MASPSSPEALEIRPGCHAWLRLPGGWGETNLGLIVGDGASLLVDTPWDARITRRGLEAFAGRTERAPITLLVNTHPDIDHWWGNAQLPAAEVVAAEAAARAMREEDPPQRMLLMRRLSELTGRIPGRVGAMGRYVAEMLAPIDFSQIDLRFPDRTFAGRHSETVGGREVELIELGAAHTASDAVVFVPDAGIVYTGDLLFAGVTPVMWHGPVSAWLAALEAILSLEADVFVPGHGPVSTRAELKALRDYWSWVAEAVTGARAAGVEALELCRRLTATPEFAAFRDWRHPERLYINVVNADRQARGLAPLGRGPVGRVRAFDGVARLADQLSPDR